MKIVPSEPVINLSLCNKSGDIKNVWPGNESSDYTFIFSGGSIYQEDSQKARHRTNGHTDHTDLKFHFKFLTTNINKIPDLSSMNPHNPLTLFTLQLLVVHLQSGNRYFVRQTYERGLTNSQPLTTTLKNPSHQQANTHQSKAAFLISEYKELSQAKIHLAALKSDTQAYLYDAEDPEHLRRLNIAASQPVGYAIYAPLLAMRQWKPTDALKAKIKSYIETRLKWKPRGSDEIGVELFLQYGELFITLKFGPDQAKLRLIEIEKY